MKRFLSIILALIMLVSLSAVSAFAAVTDASVETADGSALQIWDDIGYITGVTPKTAQEDFLAQLVPSNCELTLDCSSTYVGTGAVVNLVSDDSTVIKSYTVVLYGDVNCDGKIDNNDIYDNTVINVIVTNYEFILTKKEGYLKSDLPVEVWAAVDTNHDSVVNKFDKELTYSFYRGNGEIDQTAKPGFDAELCVYRDDLKAAIDEFNSTDFSAYSVIGVKYALNRYNKAVEVYNNPDALQKDIDNAKSALSSAINTAKSVLKTAEPSKGVLSGYIKQTNDTGDYSYYTWDKNLGILTLCPDASGVVNVPASNVTQLGLRPVPWKNSIFVTTIVITTKVTCYDTFLHSFPNLEAILITNGNCYVGSDFIMNSSNSCGKTITVYGCTNNHKSFAESKGYDFKGIYDHSVSAESGSDIIIDSENMTVTGLGAARSAADFLAYDVLTDGNCYAELDGDVAGTGAKLLIKNVVNGGVFEEYSIVLYGDVDGDGLYDATDAYKVNLIINGWLTREQVGEAAWAAADCNHDGVIDSLDAELLERAGLLLSQIDQSKPQSEIVTSDEYIEYQSLIDQSPESQESEPDITPDPEPDPEPTVFEQIVSFIRQIVEFILSFVKRLYK